MDTEANGRSAGCSAVTADCRTREPWSRLSTTATTIRRGSDSSSGPRTQINRAARPPLAYPVRYSAASAPGRSGRGSSAATPTEPRAWAPICSGGREFPRLDHHSDLGLRRRSHHSARAVIRRRPGRNRHPLRGTGQGNGPNRGGRRSTPAVRARDREADRGPVPPEARRLARAGARTPAGAPPVQRDLLRGAPPERADDRSDARGEVQRPPHGSAHEQRPRVGAALALEAPGGRDLRGGGGLG